ncbi:ly6/PLAUR domain-containing protein 5-like [Mixophyes fleayi]|uniref:ly6/PLAUR domain-containing protein 5-like n=1 Tax=Mixophyes fleayi TaxID=3061075 RepID=UPI003F4D7AA4
MAMSTTLFLSLFMSCLVTGYQCLECYICNEAEGVECPKPEICSKAMNVCTATVVNMEAGTQSESRILKNCGIGVPMISIARPGAIGFQIRLSQHNCNSSNCNNENFEPGTVQPGLSSSTSDLQCYSCISSNETKCSQEVAEKVKCPSINNFCYEAKGDLSVGGFSIPLFAKQCSQSTASSIVIDRKWYRISLTASYCSGSLCNGNLTSTISPTTLPATTMINTTLLAPTVINTTLLFPTVINTTLLPNTTKNTTLDSTTITATDVFESTSESIQNTTTGGIAKVCPCYVSLLILLCIVYSL